MREEELKADQKMIEISEHFREEWIALWSMMEDYPKKVDAKNAKVGIENKLKKRLTECRDMTSRTAWKGSTRVSKINKRHQFGHGQ